MEKYLYLTKVEWADAWVNGGVVPLFSSSTYKSEERKATFTPDENLIDTSTHDLKDFKGLVKFEGGGSVIFDETCTINGKRYPGGINFSQRTEDGLVLCMANRKSNFIAKKLGKFACVRIYDVVALKAVLDEQIGVVGEMGECKYTSNHQRDISLSRI
ncbi:hypothetical protein [Ewingella americana]|uniref:hypothetical protein n=1 Tax=Ewingella americana TaxID=41202 RepID=UPI001F304B2B|nr:hypothetical protein [Ewingella americana]